MRRLHARRVRQAGFSLIETLMSTFIFLSLLAAVYGAIGAGFNYTGVESNLAKVQMDARHALAKMSSELRMSGWYINPFAGEPPYPHVFTNGQAFGSFASETHVPATQHVQPGNPAFGDVRELVFKIPVDNDGDGLLTDGITGEVEWSTYDVSYVVLTINGVNTLVRRENGVITDYIARYVERMTCDTIYTDPTVGMNEIAITLYMARLTPKGQWVQTTMSTCVTMRNIADAS